MHRVRAVQQAYDESAGPSGIRWMIEELRVSLFAQALGTAYPVSEQRIHRALSDVSAHSYT
jgi:ATP-dependent helicase HrpA